MGANKETIVRFLFYPSGLFAGCRPYMTGIINNIVLSIQ